MLICHAFHRPLGSANDLRGLHFCAPPVSCCRSNHGDPYPRNLNGTQCLVISSNLAIFDQVFSGDRGIASLVEAPGLLMITQAMRAILAASATVTLLMCMRDCSCLSHGGGYGR